jgi:hypothetical protein
VGQLTGGQEAGEDLEGTHKGLGGRVYRLERHLCRTLGPGAEVSKTTSQLAKNSHLPQGAESLSLRSWGEEG